MKCKSCLSSIDSESIHQYEYPTNQQTIKNIKIPTTIIICENCKLGRAEPMLDEASLETIYGDYVYWSNTTQKDITRRNFPTAFSLAESRWSLIKDHIMSKSNIKLLDVGSGLGCLGIVASKDIDCPIYKYSAVDSDSQMLENLSKFWISKNLSTKLDITNDVDSLNYNADIIVLSHVLEHVNDPEYFLKSVLNKLNPDGLLFIDIPNQDYLFKSDVFPHLYFFSKESLSTILERLGLVIFDIDVWGRPHKLSPLNDKGKSFIYYLNYFLDRIFSKIFFFLNGRLHVNFYKWLFGSNIRNKDGTWIRCIAQKVK